MANQPPSIIHLYNEESTIVGEFRSNRMQHKGPKNMVAFKKVNRLQHRMVCVDTYFRDEDGSIYVEEEYVDLEDVFADYGMLKNLPQNIEVKIGKQGTLYKERLLDEAIVMSKKMQKRAANAVKRNHTYVIEKANEVIENAKICK